MRVHILGRDGYPVTSIQTAINAASGITYESVMPGGMSTASCRIPWAYGGVEPRLLGANLQIRDGIDCVWWGRIHDLAVVTEGNREYLDITAAGPWLFAAKQFFTSDYVAGGSWTGTDLFKAAVWGHCEDVAMKLGGDTGPAYDLGALAWTDSTIQDVVAEVLRLGDDTTASWNVVIWPPVFAPSGSAAYTHSHDCSTTSWFGLTTGTVTVEKGRYHRGGSCVKLVGAIGTYGRGAKAVAAAATYYASEWVWVPKDASAETTTLLSFYSSGAGANVALVRYDASYILEARNVVAGATYTATGNQTIGRGCWHHLAAQVTANAATGVIKVWYDNQLVINQSSLNTGANTITTISYGMAENSVAERTLYIDDLICSTAALDIDDTTTDETLPEPRLINMTGTTYDFMVSLASVAASTFTKTLNNAANQVQVTYGSSQYTAFTDDDDSVQAYGQLRAMPSLTRSTAGIVAGALRARYQARWKDPQPMLQPITLTTPPTARGGGVYPLSRIKAGQMFSIRERPDLGPFYVGGARYTAASASGPATCEVTPVEPMLDLIQAVARKQQRTRT